MTKLSLFSRWLRIPVMRSFIRITLSNRRKFSQHPFLQSLTQETISSQTKEQLTKHIRNIILDELMYIAHLIQHRFPKYKKEQEHLSDIINSIVSDDGDLLNEEMPDDVFLHLSYNYEYFLLFLDVIIELYYRSIIEAL